MLMPCNADGIAVERLDALPRIVKCELDAFGFCLCFPRIIVAGNRIFRCRNLNITFLARPPEVFCHLAKQDAVRYNHDLPIRKRLTRHAYNLDDFRMKQRLPAHEMNPANLVIE